MKPKEAVALIESSYRLDLSTEDWLEQIAANASSALGCSQGAMAFRYDVSSGDWVQPEPPVLHHVSQEFASEFFNQPGLPREATVALVRAFMSIRFHSSRAIFEGIGIGAHMGALFDRHGIDDLIGINGLDASGRGCIVTVVARKRAYSPRTLHLWHRLAAHISAGNRLRTSLAELGNTATDPTGISEAILTPTGKVEHATGPAEPRSAREALRDALVRIEKARAERDDANRSVDLWRALVAGRWSLVEHFERDGRRYFLAQKNDPELTQDRRLTRLERQVLAHAELGHSNKLIAYELGLSVSTVSSHLGRAHKKIGTGI
ncbi:MAG TPA: LuxR C-terminal-related transcriptional regulator [Polyangiaceae bacterium]